MTSTFLVTMSEVSRQIGDSWSSTTTAAGSTTTLVDDALKEKQNAWADNKNTWAFLIEEPTSTASIYDERLVASLATGTLTTFAFSEAPGTGINYEVHRLFKPSRKKEAIVAATRASFPAIHKKILDESLVSHNWLKDGSFEIWSSSSLTYWTTTTSTITQTHTAYYFKHGVDSMKIATAKGTVKQTVSKWDDLKKLAGKTVTFTVRAHCDKEDCLRISIADGTDTTYSDYHVGDSAWTEDNAPLSVEATIGDNPTAIEFTIYHDVAAGSSYVDDGRVMGPDNPRTYIGNLGLAQDRPYAVYMERGDYRNIEPWVRLSNISYEGGYMTLPNNVPRDYRLRVEGIGYLDFLLAGVVSTSWTASISIDQPQLDILVAHAILNLYTELSMPNMTSGDRSAYQEMMGFWKQEVRDRVRRSGMEMPVAQVNWGF